MFFFNALEERRLRPAPLTLILSSPAPLFAWLKIIDALPAKFFAEDRAHLLQAIMNWADAMRTGPFAFVMGEFQAIIILNALTRPFCCVFGVGIIIAKTRGAISINIFRGLALCNPFCHQLAHPARAAIT